MIENILILGVTIVVGAIIITDARNRRLDEEKHHDAYTALFEMIAYTAIIVQLFVLLSMI